MLLLLPGKIGITRLILAGLVLLGELSLSIWIILHQIIKLEDDIAYYPNEINKKMQDQFYKFSPQVMEAFHIKKAFYGRLFITHINLDSLEKVNERYPTEITSWERLPKSKNDPSYWTSIVSGFFE